MIRIRTEFHAAQGKLEREINASTTKKCFTYAYREKLLSGYFCSVNPFDPDSFLRSARARKKNK
jgi:hypothetical protein